MTALDSPCYLCQRRALGCHGRCKDYITYTQYRQAVNQAKQADIGLRAYTSERYFKIQRRMHNARK